MENSSDPKDKPAILVYGSYGYTGRLIAAEAASRGLPVVLSGRNAERLSAQGKQLGLSVRVASLDDRDALNAALEGCKVVIHCAGPFSRTYKAMAEACLENRVHYLDITGEIGVFEALAAMDSLAQAKGVMLMPGVGFDVVPTDCMAAALHGEMPDATHLQLAFRSVGGRMSHGTSTTMVESLGEGSLVRRNGVLEPIGAGKLTVEADFGSGRRTAACIPWGDVASAYRTTGIPNIETYIGLPKSAIRFLKMSNLMGPLLRMDWVRRLAQKRVDRQPAGPTLEERNGSKSQVWGRVKNEAGESLEANLSTLNGYSLTAKASLFIAERVLQGDVEPGYQTPAGKYGSDLIMEVDPGARISFFGKN